MLGRNLSSLINLNTKKEEIQLGNQNSGVYYIQVNTATTSTIKKVIVE